jgi:hypothetical protein
VESLLLQAAHEADERVERASAPSQPEPAAPSAPSPRHPALPRAVALALLPALCLLVSYFVAPAQRSPGEGPVLGPRVASFQTQREVRNLRLVLEMYRSLVDRYPETLADLVTAGFLSASQVSELREHEIRYRALRGGNRYVLHSGAYGPLVRALPQEGPFPRSPTAGPLRMGARRSIGSEPFAD